MAAHGTGLAECPLSQVQPVGLADYGTPRGPTAHGRSCVVVDTVEQERPEARDQMKNHLSERRGVFFLPCVRHTRIHRYLKNG